MTRPANDRHPGRQLKELRGRARWTQKEMARRAGLRSHSMVARAEQNATPRLQTVHKLLTALLEEPDLEIRPWEITRFAESLALPPGLRESREDPLVVGLLVPSVGDNNPFWGEVVGSILASAARASLLVIVSRHDNDPNRFFGQLYSLEDVPRLAGVISIPPHEIGRGEYGRKLATDLRQIFDRFDARGIPTIFVDRKPPARLAIPFVGPDNKGAAEAAIGHLYAMGHTRIAGLFGIQDDASPHQERLAGYRAALERRGLVYDERLTSWLRTDGENGVDAANRLLHLPEDIRPTAIFCATHYLTVSALEAVRLRRAAGREDIVIPKTLSVIGFDNLPAPESSRPKITCVYYDTASLGRTAMEKILALYDDPTDARARRDSRIGAFKIAAGESVLPPAAPAEPARPSVNRTARRRPAGAAGHRRASRSENDSGHRGPRIAATGRSPDGATGAPRRGDGGRADRERLRRQGP